MKQEGNVKEKEQHTVDEAQKPQKQKDAENAKKNEMDSGGAAEQVNDEQKKPKGKGAKEPKKAEKRIAELEKENAELKAMYDESMSARMRAQAEFENYKRRREAEKAEFERTALRNILLDFIEVDENMERALAGGSAENFEAYREGVSLIVDQFRSLLKKYGVERYNSLYEHFDPNLHEAMMLCEEGSYDEDTVVQVLREGYALNDKVLRLAGVKVAKAGTEEKQEVEEGEG